MTHQTAQASNELTQLLDTLVENCDMYLEMPQRDAELEQLRGRLRNERDRIRQTADADRSMIATVDGDIQAHLKASKVGFSTVEQNYLLLKERL